MSDKAKAEGWDAAIDLMCNSLRKKIELLHAESRKTTFVPAKEQFKYGVDLFKVLVEELKKAKGDPGRQKFDEAEVRALMDHTTGSIMPKNHALMEWFDEHVLPNYMAGKIKLESFTSKLQPHDSGTTSA